MQDWTTLAEADKRQFYIEAQDLSGNALHLKMQEAISQRVTKKSSVKFVGTGEWLDEQDLEEKYAKKPDQLANIKHNTRTMVCPIRRVKLFEDVKFTSETVDEECRTEERKRKIEMAPPRLPKAKAKAGAKAIGNQVVDAKLKAGDKKKLSKKADAMKACRLSLLDMAQKSERLKEYIPAYILKHSHYVIGQLSESEEKITKALDSSLGDIDTLNGDADDAIEKGNSALGRIKVQVEEATSFNMNG